MRRSRSESWGKDLVTGFFRCFRAGREIEVDADVRKQRNLLAISERDHDLSPVLGDFQVLLADRVYIVDGRLELPGLPDVADGAGALLLRDLDDVLLGGEVLQVRGEHLHSQQEHEDEDDRSEDQPHDADAALPVAHRSPLCPCYLNDPKRPSSLKLSQMKKARPTIASSGTKPQTRLSLELSRLSPITK